ncbi:hypothetical protein [Lapidilactobacillus gannanensis]|jgi:uncharacterized membrane protein YdbT with pleckstrin-like domain|uniref:Uncharacterized protein n=1 Tax=Lapidilactobacillus gannanensis TaxID=2486002 RepID=A0ABW4BP59_9LACO|nr:hypothetical protein [Lapidilactobacillus gannanensis]MCH4057729.1 hypothetical protein [Lactobacillaceae bacterium]
MINALFGGGLFLFGLVFLFHPAKQPTNMLSYKTALATSTSSGFYLAQRWCRNTLLLLGLIQISLGAMINHFQLNNLVLLWLLAIVIGSWLSFRYLEHKLRQYLMRIGHLPQKYQFHK